MQEHIQREAHVEAGTDGAVDLVQRRDAFDLRLAVCLGLPAEDDGSHLMAEDADALHILGTEFALCGHIQQADGASAGDERHHDGGVDAKHLVDLRDEFLDGRAQHARQEGRLGEFSDPLLDLGGVAGEMSLQAREHFCGVTAGADGDADLGESDTDIFFDLFDHLLGDGGALHFKVLPVWGEQIDSCVLAVEHVARFTGEGLDDGLDVFAAVGGFV